MDYPALVQKAKEEFLYYINNHPKPELYYHNIEHTREVVQNVTTIGMNYKLSEKEISLLQVAGWFHDIGYFINGSSEHEQEGMELVEAFLQKNNVESSDIEIVKNCIAATKMPQNPHNLLEEIICDADLFHLGSVDFYEKSKSLRKEIESSNNTKISKNDWIIGTLSLMKGHHFFTDYCKEKLNAQVAINIQILKDKMLDNKAASEKGEKKNSKLDTLKPSKGIETMFRITSGNNQKLSDMADNKAHILITVNSIILSAIISLLLRKLEANAYLSIPTYIMLSVSVITIIFSILATRPNLPSGIFSQKDVDDKKVNLLFFGNFYKMSLEDYNKGMQAVMNDYNYLYATLIKDVYSQGVVLSHKYKLLRTAYSFFMFGLIISVISFIVASIVN